MNAAIVDTSAILAIFDADYGEHAALGAIVESAEFLPVVSPFIVAETDYLLSTTFGAAAARRFAMDVVTGAYELGEWNADDHAAALAITERFGSGKDYLGIADASNVVLADRFRTTTVITLDQRHFRNLEPLWGADAFRILPYDLD
ncbi:PIN domain-containing protein [Microlunatus speluncae]|uniref:PIN domain-containing protein n=1 Tax=Microlunatus speluncae TaxID=2594267 RepID=UPI001375EA63|nr:PIN domain-containing protein [Microlunatus speluncae]